MKTPLQHTLPTSWYLDDDQFRRELDAIWLREWLLVGHVSEWPLRGDYRVLSLGQQQLVVTRDRQGQFHGFHNTCRHRGSRLCETSDGRFRGGRVLCPYHAWAYGLDGQLLSAPRMDEVQDFDQGQYGLYTFAVAEVEGFVYLNAGQPPGARPGEQVLEGLKPLQSWPLRELAVAQREHHEVACNWKVFWENFLECYHCPGVHPDLCRLVPIYGQGVSSAGELPEGHAWRTVPRATGLSNGAVTWSEDGTTALPWFTGLGEAEQAAGMTFGDAMPSAYLVGHVDYLRTVQVMPLSADRTRLTVTWYLHADTLSATRPDLARLTGFARQVVMEDARVAELNQQGLACAVHQHGVLSPGRGRCGALSGLGAGARRYWRTGDRTSVDRVSGRC